MQDSERQAAYELAEKLYAEENFTAAVVAGVVATVVAALLYTVLVANWPFAFGFVAAATGVVVGLAVQFAGRGVSTRFAVLAGVCTIAACLLGSLFVVLFSVLDYMTDKSIAAIGEKTMAGFSFVYCFVAVFAAGFLARRPLTRAQRFAIGTHELRDERSEQ